MSSFDDQAEAYSAIMDQTVDWVGQDHDFFITQKAGMLLGIMRRHGIEPATANVLDVGCGVGLFDSRLEGAVGSLHGVDVSDESVRVASMRCPLAHFQAYDGKRVPHPDNSFDFAFAACVMHHVPPAQWGHFAAELMRVIKPGGIAVVIEHNPFNPVTRHIVHSHPLDRGAAMLTAKVCTRLMEEAGLKPVEKRYILFVPIPGGEKIDQLLGWLPLGAQYFVAAAKT